MNDSSSFMDFSHLSKTAFAAQTKYTKEEELELVRKFQQDNDTLAYRKLRKSLRPLIISAMRGVRSSESEVSDSQLQMRVDRELPAILRKFNPNNVQGAGLTTFVTSQVSGQAKNALYEGMGGPHIPRPLHGRVNMFRQAESEAKMNYGPRPTDDQIREFIPENLLEHFNETKLYNTKSFVGDITFSNSDDGGEVTFKDMFVKDNEINSDDMVSSMQVDEVRRLIKLHLTPQEAQIVEKNKIEGIGIISVSLSLGLTSSQVMKAIRKWEKIYEQHKS